MENQVIQEIIQLLIDSTSSRNDVLSHARLKLEALSKQPEYNTYLAYIFSSTQMHIDVSIRAMAGLALKSSIRLTYNMLPENLVGQIITLLFQAIVDQQEIIRSTAGNIITTLLSRDPRLFPQVFPKLLSLLDTSEPATVSGAISALQKVCEDSCSHLANDHPMLLHEAIPKFIRFFQHPVAKVRAAAVGCVNQFTLIKADQLMANMVDYVGSLYRLTGDDSEDVRRMVCQAFVMILEARPDVLMSELNNVIEFMLYCTQSEDELIALEACEFWLTFAECDELREFLLPYLPKVVPVLLKGMVYSEDDIILLGGDDEDANIPDSVQDMKPRHHKAKTHGFGTEEGQKPPTSDFDDDEDYDEDDDDEDIYSEWNLRKCSASALDVLATMFGPELLDILLPHLKDRLFHADWEVRESAILAIGAVAEGCMDGMIPHLPQLMPILLNSVNDRKPLVRSIACWSIGRYGLWTVYPHVAQDLEAHRMQYFRPVLENLLRLCLDNNKKVQEAACSAVATLSEDAGMELVPYIEPMLQTFSVCFTKYQMRNQLILYDAIGTLSECVGHALNNPRAIELLMPPLIEKWSTLSDEDRDIFPLLECLSSVSVALGPGFAQFAEPVWRRSLNLMKKTIAHVQEYIKNPSIEEPDKDFIVVALDLISGVVQALSSQSAALIQTDPSFFQILMICMKDPLPEVRQSAYALLGDLSIHCYPLIKAHITTFAPLAIEEIKVDVDIHWTSVVNNAIWSLGEMLMRDESLGEYLPPLFERVVRLFGKEETVRTLSENCAISLGRFGIYYPAVIAPHMNFYLQKWCVVMKCMKDNHEKESALIGMARVLAQNPRPLVDLGCMNVFLDICCMKMREDCVNAVKGLLAGYKSMLGEQWLAILQSLGDQGALIVGRYNL